MLKAQAAQLTAKSKMRRDQPPKLQVKICGMTTVEQGCAIARLGATALGYICVPQSPRYIPADRLAAIVTAVTAIAPKLQHFGVFCQRPLRRNIDRHHPCPVERHPAPRRRNTCHLPALARRPNLFKPLGYQAHESLQSSICR